MDTYRCPKCHGDLRPKVVGEMQDKMLECEHCGTQVELLDEFSVEDGESESFVEADGRRITRSTKRVRTRRDLPGGEDRTTSKEFRSEIEVGPTSVELIVERVNHGSSAGTFAGDAGDPGIPGLSGLAELIKGGEMSDEIADALRKSFNLPEGSPILFEGFDPKAPRRFLVTDEDGTPRTIGSGSGPTSGSARERFRRPRRRATVDAPDPLQEPARAGGGEMWKTLAAVGFGVLITLIVIAVL